LARRRITYLLRSALGDLFFGPYSARTLLEEALQPPPSVIESHYGSTSMVVNGQRPQARLFAVTFGTLRLDRAFQQRLWLDMPKMARSGPSESDRVTPSCG
jgi:hypothetical protein